jgi:branched-chain amino acid transport system permease protein
MGLEQLPQLLVNGLLLGGLYALIAAGLSLVFGVMRVINFAHGEFVMLGGMATYWLFALYGVNPLISFVVVLIGGLLLGWAVQVLLIRRVVDAPPMMSLLLTFGMSFFLIGFGLFLWENIYRSVPAFGGSWRALGLAFPRMRIIAFGMSALLIGAVFGFLRRTRLGKALRATAQHDQVAMTCGIDVARMRAIAFAMGIGMATAAGALLVTISAIYPQVGAVYILKAFAIVVLGGLGSFAGALLGGLILGLTEVLGTFYISSAIGQASAYLVLLLVLVLRPGGLMGVAEKVRA